VWQQNKTKKQDCKFVTSNKLNRMLLTSITLRSTGIVNLCSREAETGDHHRERPKHWK